MACQLWSKTLKQRSDPVHFLLRRGLCPQPRQKDHLLRQRIALAQDLHWKDLKGHFGCVNAIEFSHGSGELIASGGDDRRVLVWQVEKMLSDIGTPAVMKGEHNSNIFCIAFDLDNKTAFSGGNDEQVVVHDIQTGETKDVFPHEDAVYGLSADPTNPSVFASACDDGRLLIYDTRDSTTDPFCVANYTSSMHSVMYNPVEPRLLATANAKEGVGLWDVRKPKSCILRYGGGYVQQSCMSVRFNQRGDQIIALRRRLPPVLYNIHSHMPVCEFDHTGYYNSCTMKSISFAGDNDQYVLSGSDDFNLYMWAIPDDLSERLYINSAHMVLRGHRSIVNQVRFNQANHLIISSGVEKIVKVWSPFRLPSTNLSVGKDLFKERIVYSHEDYINLVLRDGSMMTHDYTEASMEEDPRMMAFFDSLVQRELEGWSSDDTLSSNEEEMYSRIVQLSSSDTDSTISSISSLEDTLGNIDQLGNNAEANSHEASPATDTLVGGLGVARATTSTNERATSPHSSSRTSRKLSKLIKKKKEGLKDSFYRNRSRLTLSSSSDSSSDDDRIEAILHRGPTERPAKGKNPIAVQNIMKKKQQALKESFVKLKRLRTLRNQILNSDSDTEISVGTKVIEQNGKLNDAKDTKEFQSLQKTKMQSETASLGPYVHEMCHMFEAGSSSEAPVCSSSGGHDHHASATSTKCGCDEKCDNLEGENIKTQNVDKSNQSASDMLSDSLKTVYHYDNKWKPVGLSTGCSCLNNQISFHNNTSCDSDQTSLVNNKHVEPELGEECDNTNSAISEDNKTKVDTDSHSEINNLVNSDDNFEEKSIKSKEQISDTMPSEETCDSASEYISSKLPKQNDENDRTSGQNSVHLLSKDKFDNISKNYSIYLASKDDINSASENKLMNLSRKDKMDDTSENNSVNLTSKDELNSTSENNLMNLSSKNKVDSTSEYNSVSLQSIDNFDSKVKCNFDRNSEFKATSSFDNTETKVYDSVPSCSTQSSNSSELTHIELTHIVDHSSELTHVGDHKPHSSELSRAAWAEFKKRRKPEHSKKHYRNHKSSERRTSLD